MIMDLHRHHDLESQDAKQTSDMERGNYHRRAYLSSIKHAYLTPIRFDIDSSQMTLSSLIGLFKLILVSNQGASMVKHTTPLSYKSLSESDSNLYTKLEFCEGKNHN